MIGPDGEKKEIRLGDGISGEIDASIIKSLPKALQLRIRKSKDDIEIDEDVQIIEGAENLILQKKIGTRS